jgi:hypothetical protein
MAKKRASWLRLLLAAFVAVVFTLAVAAIFGRMRLIAQISFLGILVAGIALLALTLLIVAILYPTKKYPDITQEQLAKVTEPANGLNFSTNAPACATKREDQYFSRLRY